MKTREGLFQSAQTLFSESFQGVYPWTRQEGYRNPFDP